MKKRTMLGSRRSLLNWGRDKMGMNKNGWNPLPSHLVGKKIRLSNGKIATLENSGDKTGTGYHYSSVNYFFILATDIGYILGKPLNYQHGYGIDKEEAIIWNNRKGIKVALKWINIDPAGILDGDEFVDIEDVKSLGGVELWPAQPIKNQLENAIKLKATNIVGHHKDSSIPKGFLFQKGTDTIAHIENYIQNIGYYYFKLGSSGFIANIALENRHGNQIQWNKLDDLSYINNESIQFLFNGIQKAPFNVTVAIDDGMYIYEGHFTGDNIHFYPTVVGYWDRSKGKIYYSDGKKVWW